MWKVSKKKYGVLDSVGNYLERSVEVWEARVLRKA